MRLVDCPGLVMPNLVPPVTTVDAALKYKERLVAQDDKVNVRAYAFTRRC